MPDIAAIQALAALGTTGLLIVGILSFVSGKTRSGQLVDLERERTEKDRDGWRSIAESALSKLAELTAAILELTKTITKLRAEIAQLRSEVRRLQDTVRELGGRP